MILTYKLIELSLWIDDEKAARKELSHAADFAVRRSALFHLEDLDAAARVVGDFLHFKKMVQTRERPLAEGLTTSARPF